MEWGGVNGGCLVLKKEEGKKDFVEIWWNGVNEVVSVKKYGKRVEK